jgi:uncharacterized protein (TIGR03066 family)
MGSPRSFRKQKAKLSPPPLRSPSTESSRSPRRWILLIISFAAAASATWAIFQFGIWSALPSELVGKWAVVGGEQDGATFDFFRNGTMEGNLNVKGQSFMLKARVRVEGDKLLSTTTNPNTGQDETRAQTIVSLSRTELVLKDDQGQVLRMTRVPSGGW